MGIPELGIRKLFVQTTNYCNFNCEFCPSRVSRREQEHIAFELLRRTIDEIARHNICDAIAFYLLGEPLMYPHIVAAVAHCHERGLRSEIATNGSLLTPTNIRLLVEAGLDQLIIFLQHYGDDDHRERRAPMAFERYYRRILEAIGRLNETAGPTRVVLAFTNAAARRSHEIDRPAAIQDDGAALQTELLAIIQDVYATVGSDSGGHEKAIRPAPGKVGAYWAWLHRINERTAVGMSPLLDWGNACTGREIRPSRNGLCALAFSSMSILSNGAVTICCADYDGHTSPGNIHDRPLVEILASERIQAAQRAMGRHRLVEPHCQRCFAAGAVGAGSGADCPAEDNRPGD